MAESFSLADDFKPTFRRLVTMAEYFIDEAKTFIL
jgi:hypothetical protein